MNAAEPGSDAIPVYGLELIMLFLLPPNEFLGGFGANAFVVFTVRVGPPFALPDKLADSKVLWVVSAVPAVRVVPPLAPLLFSLEQRSPLLAPVNKFCNFVVCS